MNYLSNLTTRSSAWLLLALTALSFELSALFFQYILDLKPCIMCVYQRLAILSILAAGLVGYVGHKFIITRIIAYILWGVGSVWGTIIALEHVEMQSASGSLFFSCDLFPNFPTWAPLDQWLPWLFEATGDCGDISWQFLDYSMPQWMVVIYGFYALSLAIILLARLFIAKKL